MSDSVYIEITGQIRDVKKATDGICSVFSNTYNCHTEYNHMQSPIEKATITFDNCGEFDIKRIRELCKYPNIKAYYFERRTGEKNIECRCIVENELISELDVSPFVDIDPSKDDDYSCCVFNDPDRNAEYFELVIKPIMNNMGDLRFHSYDSKNFFDSFYRPSEDIFHISMIQEIPEKFYACSPSAWQYAPDVEHFETDDEDRYLIEIDLTEGEDESHIIVTFDISAPKNCNGRQTYICQYYYTVNEISHDGDTFECMGKVDLSEEVLSILDSITNELGIQDLW